MGEPLLPMEIYAAAQLGMLPRTVEWLRKGGHVDALCFRDHEEGLTLRVQVLLSSQHERSDAEVTWQVDLGTSLQHLLGHRQLASHRGRVQEGSGGAKSLGCTVHTTSNVALAVAVVQHARVQP